MIGDNSTLFRIGVGSMIATDDVSVVLENLPVGQSICVMGIVLCTMAFFIWCFVNYKY